MTELIQRVVDALSVGSTYALLALGLTLVYSVMNLINFAYGMLLVWTALLAVPLIDSGLPAELVVAICLAFTTLLSIAMGRAAFRPFLTAPPVTLLITSFGVELVLQYGALLFFGENPRILRVPTFLNEVLFIGGVRVPAIELITIATAGIVVLGLYALLNRTFFGMQIRAAAEQPDVARLMGISPARVLTIVFDFYSIHFHSAGWSRQHARRDRWRAHPGRAGSGAQCHPSARSDWLHRRHCLSGRDLDSAAATSWSHRSGCWSVRWH